MRGFIVSLVCLMAFPVLAQHRALAVGNDKLMVFAADGKVEWEMPWKGGTHDSHVLPNGNYLAVRDAHVVVEIDSKIKERCLDV